MPNQQEYSHQLLGYFFRSCVAFYNAKPWKTLREVDDVRINVDIEPPVFANVSGGGAGGANRPRANVSGAKVADADTKLAPGLSLISAYSSLEEANREIEEVGQLWTDLPFSGARVSMMFRPEQDAPQWLRDLRRANKWPLASSSTFPVFFATDVDGTARELQGGELRALTVAVNVIATFVATRRKHIEAGARLREVVAVRDDAGAEKIALVQFPFDPNAPDGWQLYKQHHGEDAHANPAFQEVRNAALDLPDVNPILNRLVWSFFQDTDPNYLPNEDDQEDATMRFLSWAIFGARINGTTLAERALATLAETKSEAELAVHRQVVNPRAGMFRVVAVKRNVGMQLLDVERGDTLDVVERVGTRGLRAGNGLLGTLHPISDTQWIMSPGAAMYEEVPDASVEDKEEALPIESFGPVVEASVFGAGLEWTRALDPEELRDAYQLFAGAVTASGDVMPTYHELQAEIGRLEQPAQMVEKFGGIASWTETETDIVINFLMIIWNATPRAELGGRTPEAVFAEGGRVRATRSGAGRRWR